MSEASVMLQRIRVNSRMSHTGSRRLIDEQETTRNEQKYEKTKKTYRYRHCKHIFLLRHDVVYNVIIITGAFTVTNFFLS